MDGKGKISILSAWLRRRRLDEMGIVVLILLIVAGIWGFVEVANKVGGEETPGLDERFFNLFKPQETLPSPSGPPGWMSSCATSLPWGGGPYYRF